LGVKFEETVSRGFNYTCEENEGIIELLKVRIQAGNSFF